MLAISVYCTAVSNTVCMRGLAPSTFIFLRENQAFLLIVLFVHECVSSMRSLSEEVPALEMCKWQNGVYVKKYIRSTAKKRNFEISLSHNLLIYYQIMHHSIQSVMVTFLFYSDHFVEPLCRTVFRALLVIEPRL